MLEVERYPGDMIDLILDVWVDRVVRQPDASPEYFKVAVQKSKNGSSEISNFAVTSDNSTQLCGPSHPDCLSLCPGQATGRSIPPQSSVTVVSVSLLRLLSVWIGPTLMRGIFPGKVIWKEKKKNGLNSKSMFHSISLPLCGCIL